MFCPIANNSNKYPDDIAVKDGSVELSYSQLNTLVKSCQHYLLDLGVSYNDKLVIISENSVNCIAFMFAIWRINAQAFPLNPSLPIYEIKRILKKSNTSFLICKADYVDQSEFNNIRIIDIGEVVFEEVTTDLINCDINEVNNSLLIQTSGSSSESKIVVLDYSNLYYSALGVLEKIELNRGDNWLLSLPLFHVGGIGVLIRCFLKGASVIIINKEETILENIRVNKITHLSLVSTQLYKLIDEINNKENIKLNIKSILLGGSSILAGLIEEALEINLPIFTSYGSSEMSSTVSIQKQLQNKQTYISSGTLLKYRDIKISNDEIFLKGKTLFKGYLKDNTIELPIDKDGWFNTGDIGYIDNKNELIITGRKDNMFISGGENVQPEEIEKKLLEIPEIIDVKVLPIKDEKFGFRPIAFLKTKNGSLPNIEIIKKKMMEKLPKFKIPDAFYPWPKIEDNTIKLKKSDFVY